MKKLYLSTLLLVTMLFAACNNNILFEEQRTFGGGTWNRFNAETFEVSATDNETFYNFYITAVIDTARYKLSSLPLNINIYSPNGERRMFTGAVPLRTQSCTWNGTIENGSVTVSKCVRDCFCFNTKGDYKLEIGQATHYYDLRGISSITLRIEKTKLDLPE